MWLVVDLTTGCTPPDEEVEEEAESEVSLRALTLRRTTLSPQVVSLVSLAPDGESPCPSVPKDLYPPMSEE